MGEMRERTVQQGVQEGRGCDVRGGTTLGLEGTKKNGSDGLHTHPVSVGPIARGPRRSVRALAGALASALVLASAVNMLSSIGTTPRRLASPPAIAASSAAAAATGLRLPAASVPTRAAAPLLEQPCVSAKNRGRGSGGIRDDHPRHYEPVPSSLDLFRRNSIVCPHQTPRDLLGGTIDSASPELWAEYRRAAEVTGRSRRGLGKAGGDDNGEESKPNKGRGLIVFKRGGSGSTWFGTLLRDHPAVDFRHEAHTKVFAPSDGPKEATERMHNFLKRESSECRSDGGLCGFSVSPTKHAVGVDWAGLIQKTGAPLVVFLRTNIVKRMAGLQRKAAMRALPRKCRQGSSYRAELRNTTGCRIARSMDFNLTRLATLEKDCFDSSWDLLETAMKVGVPFQILTYEGMQQNLTQTFERLGHFTGWPLSEFDWTANVKTGKVSSEDLRDGISNYDHVADALRGKPCFLDMLHSGSKQMFPLCYAPRKEPRSITT